MCTVVRVCGSEREEESVWPEFVVGVNAHTKMDMQQHTHRDRNKKKKLTTFSLLSPLEQSCFCGCCSSLLGLFGSRSRGH